MISFIVLGGHEAVGTRWYKYKAGGHYEGCSPSFSPDGRNIIFSSPATGHGDIYSVNIDGTNKKRLTTSKKYEGEPSYSFDGNKICYFQEDRFFIQNRELYLMDKDGNNQKKLTTNLGFPQRCSFSPDGRQIVFEDNESEDIYLINIDGSGLKRLNTIEGIMPFFSSDGKSIYYSLYKYEGNTTRDVFEGAKSVEIWNININNLQKEMISIIQIEKEDFLLKKIYPKFQKILYSKYIRPKWQIFMSNIDGDSETQLTSKKHNNINPQDPSFSWDAQRVIFISDSIKKDNNPYITILKIDGTKLENVCKVK